MNRIVNNEICLESITKSSTEALYPLFVEDIAELNRWFGFDVDYSIENDYRYLEIRKPPYDDAIVILFRGAPCGRVGLYDYNKEESSIFMYYWVSSRYRRKGIARASMGAMLEYLREIHIKEVQFDVDQENIDSVSLLGKFPEIRLKSKEKRLVYSCRIG